MASLDAIRPPTPAIGAVRHTKPGNARRRSCSGVAFIAYMFEKSPSIGFWPNCSGANLTTHRAGRQGGEMSGRCRLVGLARLRQPAASGEELLEKLLSAGELGHAGGQLAHTGVQLGIFPQ